MKLLPVLVATAMLFAFAPVGAYAINVNQAFGYCDKDPKCEPTTNGNGSVTFTNGTYTVDCPQEGECVCTICRTKTGIVTKTLRPVDAMVLLKK